MVIDKVQIEKDIKRLLEKQKRIRSYTEYLYLQFEIDTLIKIYYEITGEYITTDIYSSYKLEEYVKKKRRIFLYPISDYFYYQDNATILAENFLNEYEDAGFINYDMWKSTRRLSDKEFLEILRAFLSDYDERLYKTFESARKNNLIDVDTKKSSFIMETEYTLLSEKSYILAQVSKDIYGLEVLSHELGHYYTFEELYKRSKKHAFDFSISFFEMYSIFLEFLFYDFMKKNHIYMRDTIATQNAFYASYPILFEDLRNCSEFSSEENDYDVLDYIRDSYIYSYGFAIALQMHERYLAEPKDVKKRLDNFIFSTGLIYRDEQLDVLGITNEDIEDSKILRKRLEKHNEDMKKYVVRQKI